MVKEVVKRNARILYVEPNDVYGTVNGIPVTPPYEDFCISFNLIVEVTSRYKPNVTKTRSGTTENGDKYYYVLSWTSNDDTKGSNWVSFLKGYGKNYETFLTTYYTDISYEDIRKRDIVEGLGVERVDISYESYYTPLITIRFIDVRGSALFGREETLHDQNKEGLEENIYSCFFMQPYPKFKLQVKGFYGEAVTFQLTCSDFRGSFNPSNGNFEATAQFIGYTYGLLTDIPLLYLVSAPFCSYKGSSYWAGMKSKSSWLLDGWNDEEVPMVTFYDLMYTIDSHMIESNDHIGITEADQQKLRTIENEVNMLSSISDSLKSLKTELKKSADYWIMGTNPSGQSTDPNRVQMLLMYDTVNEDKHREITSGTINAHSKLLENIDAYNLSFSEYRIPKNLYPNGKNTPYYNGAYYTLMDIASYTISKGEMNVTPLYNKDSLIDSVQKELLERINEKSENNRKFGRYGFVYDFYTLGKVVNDRLSLLNSKKIDIKAKIKKATAKELAKTLPMKPTIGNIFKIIMAHLETFCHIISQSVTDINESDDRSPNSLGISITSTDALHTSIVPPWPGVYKCGEVSENGGSDSTSNNIKAWPGDFEGKWTEEDVITQLCKAALRIEDEVKNTTSEAGNMRFFPIMPCDYNFSNTPFANTSLTDISSLAGYLGIRMAQIFGVMFNSQTVDTTLCQLIGRMDAYNYYGARRTKSGIKSDIIDVAGKDTTLSTALWNIMTCTESGDEYGTTYSDKKRRHTFETSHGGIREAYNNNGREPIFSSNVYVRYYTNNSFSLIPARLDEFTNYSNTFVWTKEIDEDGNIKDIYFKPQFLISDTMVEADGFLHCASTFDILENDDELEKYSNKELFNIITDNSDILTIETKYEEYKAGKVSMTDYEKTEDFTPLIESVWNVSDEDYAAYFNCCSGEVTLDTSTLFGDNYSQFVLPSSEDDAKPMYVNYDWRNVGLNNGVSYGTDGELTYVSSNSRSDGSADTSKSQLTLEDVFIQQCDIYELGEDTPYSLFGHSFYYLQNENSNTDTALKAKCLLFLHTLRYNFTIIPKFISKVIYNGGIETVPYGYLLLLGGLLWRHRYYLDNGVDPIITEEASKKVTFQNTGTTYMPFLIKDGSRYKFIVGSSKATPCGYVTYTDFWGIDLSDLCPDYFISNRLVRLFEHYAENEYPKISNVCDLRYRDPETGENYSFNVLDSSALPYMDFSEWIKYLVTSYKIKRNITSAILASDADMYDRMRETVPCVFGKYDAVNLDNKAVRGIRMLFRKDNTAQKAILNLYYKKAVVLLSTNVTLVDNTTKLNTNSGSIYITESNRLSYLSAFANELTKIAESEDYANGEEDIYDEEWLRKNRDVSISMYWSIKNIYDRWFIPAYANDYDVSTFFNNNFTFIDKFYVNIRDILIINCEKLSRIFHDRILNAKSSVFLFISDIVKEHKCMFVGLPDYVGFGQDEENNIAVMEKLFTPISFAEKSPIRDQNHFVIIYVGERAINASENNEYIWDGFDIDGDIDALPTQFTQKPLNYSDSEHYTKYGYNVPSFGVTFARQNQSVFKSISLEMTNPMNTDISIGTLSNIAKLGSGGEHKIMYYGQDVYNIYSNYSYECEVTMMGNAQIMPLMYFQLHNIPMWHGAYMIYNVTHTMSPGNMTTTFKGQKMSKYNVPYCTEFYTENEVDDVTSGLSREDEMSITSSDSAIVDYPYSYAGSSEEGVKDVLSDSNCNGNEAILIWKNGTTVSDEVRSLFNKVSDRVAVLQDSNVTWGLCISSAIRNNNSDSDHYYAKQYPPANALDIQIVDQEGRKIKYLSGRARESYEKIMIVMDILATEFLSEVGQVIFEGGGDNSIFKGTYQNSYTCLHFSGLRSNGENGQIFLSNTCEGANVGILTKDVSLLSRCVPVEYKNIAYKYYKQRTNRIDFVNKFIYYRRFNEEELSTHFAEFEKNEGLIKSNNGVPTRRKNPGNVKWVMDGSTIVTSDNCMTGVDKSGLRWSSTYAVYQTWQDGATALFVLINKLVSNEKRKKIEDLIGAWEWGTTTVASSIADKCNKDVTYKVKPIRRENDNLLITIAKQIADNTDGIILEDKTWKDSLGAARKIISK